MVKNKLKNNTKLLSVIIIAKNEEEKLPDCLESVKWADDIILIDSGSTDKTVSIAKKYNANVFEELRGSYQDWRNKGLKVAKGEWILYLDADERVTLKLKEEVLRQVELGVFSAYAIARRNFILGREMKHGGQWPDYQKRLFKRSALKTWKGDLHEEPEIQGKLGHIKEPMIHIKHDSLTDMVTKTNKWSKLEAKLLFDSGHPRIVWWRFIRIMLTELWIRLIKQGGILDGVEGTIYSIYQMWSKFITYGKLWEMQIEKDIKHSLR